MKRLMIIAAACVAAALCANANYEWRGTTGEWSDSAANWWDDTTSSTVPWTDGSYAYMPVAGAGVATDLTIDANGVTASTFELPEGASYTLSGGPLSATTAVSVNGSTDGTNPASLTINNSVTANEFYFRGGVTIANGGKLTCGTYNPQTAVAAGLGTAKVTVLAGGTLEVSSFVKSAIQNNYSTLYVDGGTIKHALPNSKWNQHYQHTTSKIKMGPRGMYFEEALPNNMMFLPYPIENDGGDSEGLWLGDHSSELVLYGSNTFKGGIHIKQGGAVRVQSDGNLGYLPESPTNWIFFVGDGTKRESSILESHNNSNLVTLNKNRNILIGDYVKARLSTFNADQRFVIHGTFDCENQQNGVLQTGGYGGNGGTIILEPPADGTNHIGRLFVGQPTVIGSGTTLLENTSKLTWGVGTTGLGDNEEGWGVHYGSCFNIAGSGHLMVTGGVVKALGRMPCNSARLTISGSGIVDFSTREFMNGYYGPGTTTIRDGGRLLVSSIRMAGDNGSYYGNADNSIVNVETGGTLRVRGTVYIGHDGRKGTLNFNGGTLEWANANTGQYMSGSFRTATANGLKFSVLEGGMTVSNVNNNAFYIGVPILSGAEHDGGITVYGGGTFALMGACTFNGPLTIMQGEYRLGASNALNSNVTVRVNSGVDFIMNTRNQSVARIEGLGTFKSTFSNPYEKLSITRAIAPGMSADSPGTLTVANNICNIADDVVLEIDLDENGNSDCLSYPVEIDLSKMTLQVNDLTKLNKDKKYTIAKLNGGIKDGKLFKSTNLPANSNWTVCYYASTHELKIVDMKGTMIVIR